MIGFGYIMVVCAGISWGGCAFQSRELFADRFECEASLASFVAIEPTRGDNGRSTIAYCRPALPGEPDRLLRERQLP